MKNKELQKKDGFAGEWMYILPTESFIEFINNPIVGRMYLTDIGFFPNAKHHYRERPEGADENIFLYCTHGCGTIELATGKKITLEENQAFTIPAKVGHKYFADEDNPWSIFWLHFRGSDVAYYPMDDYEVATIKTKQKAAQIMSNFNELYNLLNQNYTLGNFITITNGISHILSEVYLASQSDTKDNSFVTSVIRFMYENQNKTFTIRELADEFQVSPSYISSQFKENTGHGPIEFFNKLKVDEACKLLRSTNLKIYEISQAIGIADQYYFSRLFKKQTGVSPREYRG